MLALPNVVPSNVRTFIVPLFKPEYTIPLSAKAPRAFRQSIPAGTVVRRPKVVPSNARRKRLPVAVSIWYRSPGNPYGLFGGITVPPATGKNASF